MNGYVRTFGKLREVVSIPVDEKTKAEVDKLKRIGRFNDEARQVLLELIDRLNQDLKQAEA